MKVSVSKSRKVGYAYLLEKFNIDAIQHWHISAINSTKVHRSQREDNFIEDIYPSSYWPGDSIGDHLEFALKYDGVNLNYLFLIFSAANKEEVVDYIKSKPIGKYARRIWFFYEFLLEKELPIDAITKGNYVEAIEPNRYYTIENGKRAKRQRIVNNLLGSKEFLPIVRKTPKLREMESIDFSKKCNDIVASYPIELLRRALSYLYSKETKSSFEIENIKPNSSRIEKFISLLELAEHKDFCEKELLIDLQNRIVDSRFIEKNYREIQNYVGQTISFQNEIIHFIPPRPNDLDRLMNGLLDAHQIIKSGNIPSVVHAAIIAYGFVFLHPFEDGNGRIHRFLIHNIFSITGMVPKGLMFPVSAVMLKNRAAYDESLERFSKQLLRFVEYNIDSYGKMRVSNQTTHWYRYIDMTSQVEALYDFVNQTIEKELVEELSFLASYDSTKKAIQNIIDMPNRSIDLFIQLVLNNNGKLSKKKRDSHFDFLTDDEIVKMEDAIRDGYKLIV